MTATASPPSCAPAPQQYQEFPTSARKQLDAFYQARKVKLDDTEGKIKLLRDVNDMEHTLITADGGIDGAGMELRALEFYFLTKLGLI